MNVDAKILISELTKQRNDALDALAVERAISADLRRELQQKNAPDSANVQALPTKAAK